MMELGQTFPINKLRNESGPIDLNGSRFTVVYFYPKDDTPGCTIEANEFQKMKPEYDANQIRILGVSSDDATSHRTFCEKFGLAFELATDEGAELGKEMGIAPGKYHQRVTLVLDEAGKVVLTYPQVAPAGHAKEILHDIAKLG